MLFALGGGVVGDIAGFAAATYMRGIPFVQVPTTLLAQVDSSVGGKTAINHPLGKNMIGAFYQPRRVVCDLDVLDTLPDREMSAGLAEVIKYGASIDVEFLGWLERHVDALRARDRAALVHAVRRCCEIKAQVVGADEKEAGLRAILNFGHTFGHAIEAGLGYGAWLHGEAVGCGMVMAAELSARLGLVSIAFARRIETLVARAGLPVRGPKALSAARYLELMRVDKKAEGGDIRFVLLDGESHASLRAAPEALVIDVIDALTEPRLTPRVDVIAGPRASARVRQRSRAVAWPTPPRGRSPDAHRVPARSRSHRPQHRLPAPGLQDPGLPEPRGRPVPHAAHAFAGSGATRALRRAHDGARRGPGRGDRAGA